jgi:Polysulphide reductase, NrfD
MTTSYYGQPVIKPPVWTWEVPTYFFTGGVAGASSVVAVLARLSGDDELAARSRAVAAGAAAISPALLVSDLGRPGRFHHMLRVVRPTSPMSLGSWLLGAYAPAALGAAVLGRSGRRGWLQGTAETVAAALGPGLATYTAVLLADTAVPVWHEARRELPFVFAGGAIAGAGGLAMMAGAGSSGAARGLAVLGTVSGQIAGIAMERRLGELGEPYRQGTAGGFSTAGKMMAVAGIVAAMVGRDRHRPARLAAALMVASAVCERWAVFRAGFQSAADPAYTVAPQRKRLDSRPTGGGTGA